MITYLARVTTIISLLIRNMKCFSYWYLDVTNLLRTVKKYIFIFLCLFVSTLTDAFHKNKHLSDYLSKLFIGKTFV